MQRARDHWNRSRPLACIKILDDAIKLRRREVFVEIVVDLHRRRAGTSANTFNFFKGKDAVLGGFFVPDFEPLFGLLKNFVPATKHARDVGADLHVMFAHGLATQHRIVRESFLDLDGAKVEPASNFRDHFSTDKAKFVLRVHHHRYQGAAFYGIRVLQSFESCRELWRNLHRDFAFPASFN